MEQSENKEMLNTVHEWLFSLDYSDKDESYLKQY